MRKARRPHADRSRPPRCPCATPASEPGPGTRVAPQTRIACSGKSETPLMSNRRVGLWLIGAFGGVGSTAALGLAALGRGLTDTTSLVTALPLFDGLDLDAPAHVRRRRPRDPQGRLSPDRPRVPGALQHLRPRPDRRLQAGPGEVGGQRPPRHRPQRRRRPSAGLADWPEALRGRHAARRRRTDPGRFAGLQGDEQARSGRRRQRHLDGAAVRDGRGPPVAGEADAGAGSQASRCCRPAPLYAWAALDLGLPYINFTPSLGASFPAAEELAEQRGAVYGGKDGKTGETLLKTVLAPMFAHAQLAASSAGSATTSSATATAWCSTTPPTRRRRSAPRTR